MDILLRQKELEKSKKQWEEEMKHLSAVLFVFADIFEITHSRIAQKSSYVPMQASQSIFLRSLADEASNLLNAANHIDSSVHSIEHYENKLQSLYKQTEPSRM